MSLTTFDATPQKPDGSIKGAEAQNALAQALTGKTLFNEADRSAMQSFAKGGTQALQQTLDGKAMDMKTLENQGHLPESKKVADIDKATDTDKSAPIQSMMQNEVANNAMDNALQNVEQNPKS